MIVGIASGIREALHDHARSELPREACGLLFGHGVHIERAEPAANVAVNPERTFEIDPAALLRWHREARGAGQSIIGWYHSHPNRVAEPSKTDAARAVEDGKLWLIVTDTAITAWRVAPEGRLLGRFEPVALCAT